MSVPPGYNPAASMLSGGQDQPILPVQGGGGMNVPPGYNYTASLLKGGLDEPIVGVQGGGAFLASVPQPTEIKRVPGFGRAFSIRIPNAAAVADWKSLQFTEDEAEFLNKIEPGDFVGIFESPEEAGEEVAVFLQNVVEGRCTEFTPYQLSSNCFKTRKILKHIRNRKEGMSGARSILGLKPKPTGPAPAGRVAAARPSLNIPSGTPGSYATSDSAAARTIGLTNEQVFDIYLMRLHSYFRKIDDIAGINRILANSTQKSRWGRQIARKRLLEDNIKQDEIFLVNYERQLGFSSSKNSRKAAHEGYLAKMKADRIAGVGAPNLFEPRPKARIPVPVSPGLAATAAAAPAGLGNLGLASRRMATPGNSGARTGLNLGAAASPAPGAATAAAVARPAAMSVASSVASNAAGRTRRNNLANQRARVATLAHAPGVPALPGTPSLARTNSVLSNAGTAAANSVILEEAASVPRPDPRTIANVLARKRTLLQEAEGRLNQAQTALAEAGGQRFSVRPTYFREDITGTQVPIYINTKNNKLFGNIRRGMKFYRLKADTADALKAKFTPEALSRIDTAESEMARAQASVQAARTALSGAQSAERRQASAEEAARKKSAAARAKAEKAVAAEHAILAAGPAAVEAAKPTFGQRFKSFFTRSKGGRSTRRSHRKNRSTRKANRKNRGTRRH